MLVAWRSGNVFRLINEVTLCQAGLVLRQVTACGQVNHLSIVISCLGQLSLPSLQGR